MTKDEWYRQLFERLDNSKFRSSFHLKQKDIDYINKKGLETIRQHAKDFITKREAPAYIANDGKQTPMRGHPVFIAQHATATCCRECIRKWHKMQPGKELSQVQQDYLVDVMELAAKIAVRTVARFLQENPGQFDLVEWVLFDSYTESVYEAEATLYYNIRI